MPATSAPYLMEGAAQTLDALATCVATSVVVIGRDLDVHTDHRCARPLGESSGPSEHCIGVRAVGHRHDHLLVRPGRVLRPSGESIRHPEHHEPAQLGERAGVEQVGVLRPQVVGPEDVAMCDPPPDRLGRDVHDLDLLRADQELVGHQGVGHATDDLAHGVSERVDLLNGERGDHVDPGIEQGVHVLPTVLTYGFGRVSMCQLVDEHHARSSRQHRGDVEVERTGRRRAELGQPGLDHRSPVGQHAPDHHIGAATLASQRLVEHGVGGAHARGGPQVHTKTTSLHTPKCAAHRGCFVERERRRFRPGWGWRSCSAPVRVDRRTRTPPVARVSVNRYRAVG